MRSLPVVLSSILGVTTPAASAQAAANADTYREIIAHGVVIVLPEMEIDVKFSPDGKFTALGGQSSGVWKIDGDKLCSTPDETLMETCGVYPAGKKSGDTFEIAAPTGRLTVRIP